MRILVDIEESDVQALDQSAADAGQSRAALIRKAISEFLGKGRAKSSADAFGLWGKGGKDGLAYQRDIRREW